MPLSEAQAGLSYEAHRQMVREVYQAYISVHTTPEAMANMLFSAYQRATDTSGQKDAVPHMPTEGVDYSVFLANVYTSALEIAENDEYAAIVLSAATNKIMNGPRVARETGPVDSTSTSYWSE